MAADVASPLANGRLRLRQVLGEGGVGTVYLAYDSRLALHRAVKILAEERAANPVQRHRFETEARIQAGLRHPNIVQVYDIAEEEGRVYMVMELVHGGSLWDRLERSGRMAPLDAIDACIGILNALELAHDRDIVHRDIKPHNILISRKGTPKLADFGVAHLPAMASQEITRTGMVMGTWAFMAPEQRASSRRVDRRSDIYAVGATLYTLVAARTDPNLFDYDEAHEAFIAVPGALRAHICRATRYAREERYPDAPSMREALQAARLALAPASEEQAPPPQQSQVSTQLRLATTAASDAPSPIAPVATSAPGHPTIAEPEDDWQPPARAEPTFVEEAPLPATAPLEREPAAHAVPVPIEPGDGSPLISDDPLSPKSSDEASPARLTWTLDGEGEAPEEVPVRRTWRTGSRQRFVAFLALLALASAALAAWRAGWLSSDEVSVEEEEVLAPTKPEPQAEHTRTERPAAESPSGQQGGSASAEPKRPEPDHRRTVSVAAEPRASEAAPAASDQAGSDEEPAAGSPAVADEEPVAEPAPTQKPVQDADEDRPAESVPTPPPYDESMSPDEVIAQVVASNGDAIHGCHSAGLEANPALEGALVLRLLVENGRLSSATALDWPDGGEALADCVQDAAHHWAFPAGFSVNKSHSLRLAREQTSAHLIQARLPELQACVTDPSAPLGRVPIALQLTQGAVTSASITEERGGAGEVKASPAGEAGSEPLNSCLLSMAQSWTFPSFVEGPFNMDVWLHR